MAMLVSLVLTPIEAANSMDGACESHTAPYGESWRKSCAPDPGAYHRDGTLLRHDGRLSKKGFGTLVSSGKKGLLTPRFSGPGPGEALQAVTSLGQPSQKRNSRERLNWSRPTECHCSQTQAHII